MALVANLFRAFVAAVALFIILGFMGINLTPLLASATVIGATIGFGAQALVRDYLSGALLTMEDQFGIGDAITVNNITGTVEDLSLRVTRVRAFDGTVWFVPNGDIRAVANASRGWARSVVDVSLGPENIGRIEEAKQVLAEAAIEVAHGPRYSSSCTEPPQVVGVVAADGTGLTLRVALRTSSANRDPLTRSLREAVLAALAEAELWPPVPPAGPHRLRGATTPEEGRSDARSPFRMAARATRTGQPRARSPSVDGPGADGGQPSRRPISARAAAHMASSGGSIPVHSPSWIAAWCTSIPRPPRVRAPAAAPRSPARARHGRVVDTRSTATLATAATPARRGAVQARTPPRPCRRGWR